MADTGPGIPPEQRERIFERFVQGEEPGGGAAGLGLAIVRDIVQAHGGRIFLDSELGRGSRFTLELPRAVDATRRHGHDPHRRRREEHPRATSRRYVRGLGHRVADRGRRRRGAARALDARAVDVVLSDVRMAGMDGSRCCASCGGAGPDAVVVLMTAYATIAGAVEAMREGAYDYLVKPFALDEVGLLLERALEVAALRRENRELRRALDDAAAARVAQRARCAARSTTARRAAESDVDGAAAPARAAPARTCSRARSTPGARAARRRSSTVSCTTLAEHLLESELFGHVKGAFTGAWKDKPGRLEAAAGGTLFLDEIGELPPELQAKLLRFLEERRFERVGDTRTREVDARDRRGDQPRSRGGGAAPAASARTSSTA